MLHSIAETNGVKSCTADNSIRVEPSQTIVFIFLDIILFKYWLLKITW